MNSESSDGRTRKQFTRHWLASESSVSTYVFAAIPGFHDAEDVIQQIALNAAGRFDEYDSARPFLGWILWIARSRVIDFYRQQGRQKIVFSEEVLQQLADAISAREVTMSARREALEQCLNRSPTRSRQLLDLRYIHELPTENISKTVALTADSVRVSLTRIRNALGDCIQKRPSLEDLS